MKPSRSASLAESGPNEYFISRRRVSRHAAGDRRGQCTPSHVVAWRRPLDILRGILAGGGLAARQPLPSRLPNGRRALEKRGSRLHLTQKHFDVSFATCRFLAPVLRDASTLQAQAGSCTPEWGKLMLAMPTAPPPFSESLGRYIASRQCALTCVCRLRAMHSRMCLRDSSLGMVGILANRHVCMCRKGGCRSSAASPEGDRSFAPRRHCGKHGMNTTVL